MGGKFANYCLCHCVLVAIQGPANKLDTVCAERGTETNNGNGWMDGVLCLIALPKSQFEVEWNK